MGGILTKSLAVVLFALIAVQPFGAHWLSRPESGLLLLVLNKSDSTLAIVDPARLKVLDRIPTGKAPHELITSADGRLAFVSNYGTADRPGNTISVIEIATRKEVKRIDLGALSRPHGIVESSGRIYFTIENSRSIARYDVAAGRIDWIMGTGQGGTHMIVVGSRLQKIYTANRDSNTVSAIEPASGNSPLKMTQITVGRGPEGIALSPDDREVWAAHRGDGGLSIIDTSNDQVKEVIKVGRAPIRVKFTTDGRRVLISDSQAADLVVIDASSRKEIKRLAIGGNPGGILVQPDGKRAFVASSQANKVVVINLENLSIEGSVETGRDPDGLAWAK
jgi:YVTN family beta-propeller protein